jgi:hypothetical protein
MRFADSESCLDKVFHKLESFCMRRHRRLRHAPPTCSKHCKAHNDTIKVGRRVQVANRDIHFCLTAKVEYQFAEYGRLEGRTSFLRKLLSIDEVVLVGMCHEPFAPDKFKKEVVVSFKQMDDT